MSDFSNSLGYNYGRIVRGHISYDLVKTPQINGRLVFTFSSKILYYVKYLKFNVLASICTKSEPTPWPNSLKPTQYWFSTRCLPAISQLHSVWYKHVDNAYVKIVPSNIKDLLSAIGLAHWIMGDGYFAGNVVNICTDNFTKEEVLILIKALNDKFGIKATINKRTNPNGKVVWRIRVSKNSMANLINISKPYFIPEMLYKLGIS